MFFCSNGGFEGLNVDKLNEQLGVLKVQTSLRSYVSKGNMQNNWN